LKKTWKTRIENFKNVKRIKSFFFTNDIEKLQIN